MKARVHAVLVMTLLGSSARLVGAQNCAGPDETSEHIRGYLVALATATDSSLMATRDAQGIPAAVENEVALVTNSALCATAGSAYAAAERDSMLTGGRVPQPADSTLGATVYVFQVKNRYVVVDERNMAGEFALAWVFDQTFATPLKRLGL